MVENLNTNKIYDILNSTIITADRWLKKYGHRNFKYNILCFSDTILLWPTTDSKESYEHLIFLGRIIFCDLLAHKIPVRGTIVYGDFNVKKDASHKHQLFWGKSLINAYITEKKENWLGITINPSAYNNYLTKGKVFSEIKKGVKDRLWYYRSKDKYLLLNPFFFTNIYFEEYCHEDIILTSIYNQYLRVEKMAFNFIRDRARFYSRKRHNDRTAKKYYTTNRFIKNMLGKDRYNWVSGIIHTNDRYDTLEEKEKAYLPNYLPPSYG